MRHEPEQASLAVPFKRGFRRKVVFACRKLRATFEEESAGSRRYTQYDGGTVSLTRVLAADLFFPVPPSSRPSFAIGQLQRLHQVRRLDHGQLPDPPPRVPR